MTDNKLQRFSIMETDIPGEYELMFIQSWSKASIFNATKEQLETLIEAITKLIESDTRDHVTGGY